MAIVVATCSISFYAYFYDKNVRQQLFEWCNPGSFAIGISNMLHHWYRIFESAMAKFRRIDNKEYRKCGFGIDNIAADRCAGQLVDGEWNSTNDDILWYGDYSSRRFSCHHLRD